MPGPFEGMGATLTGVLGAPVIHRPVGGGEFTRRWHVREYPDDVFGGERPVQSATAEARIPRDQLSGVGAGDQIETEDGRRFVIGARIPTPNPGADALVPFELRKVET